MLRERMKALCGGIFLLTPLLSSPSAQLSGKFYYACSQRTFDFGSFCPSSVSRNERIYSASVGNTPRDLSLFLSFPEQNR
ncbi:hypothetical protein DL96DRAFT_1585977 [Flagelloscypha sp. PMI_526]|nr:hypothetical protein DL96DRAFT_1585977 [Flagelloscypha sp. PMI_526]